MLRCARFFSSTKLRGISLDEILKKVPQQGRVNLIGRDGKANIGVSLREGYRLKPGQDFQIVNFKPNSEEGADPTLTVKIVKKLPSKETKRADVPTANKREKKVKPTKPAETKDVVISWNISKNDLDGPKRKSIESILGRGHRIRLKLESKNRFQKELTPAEIEAREKLLERVTVMLEENGVQWMKPDGAIGRKLMLFYKAKE